MPKVTNFRKHGENITVIAYGEVLFTPGGQISRWLNGFSQSVSRRARAFAPRNSRPRWLHYGEPLHKTIHASTPQSEISRNGSVMRLHSAVGSTAPYAYYVDQGTGVYNGSAPYKAKILPPWDRGSPSLYEHTWRPNPKGGPVREVWIKGQRPQFFFQKALDAVFAERRLASVNAPVSLLSDAESFEAFGLPGHMGNTPWSFAFDVQLREWRAWRDAAFNKGRVVGRNKAGEPRTWAETNEGRRRAEAQRVRDAKRAAKQKERESRKKKVLKEVAELSAAEKERRRKDARREEEQRIKEANAAKARAIAERKAAIEREYQNLVEQAKETYGPKGYFVKVSRRIKKDGRFQFRIDLRGKTTGVIRTLWIDSDYQ